MHLCAIFAAAAAIVMFVEHSESPRLDPDNVGDVGYTGRFDLETWICSVRPYTVSSVWQGAIERQCKVELAGRFVSLAFACVSVLESAMVVLSGYKIILHAWESI